jgi:hypothetical protein
MTIVWGHNNFRLKSVEPHEIGLFGEGHKNIRFELRQKYGHLFWIPFIPLGKVWVVTKGDGNKYVCPADIEHHLDQLNLGSSKASIFAWSGLLLILFGFIVFSISEKVSSIHYEAAAKESFQQEAVSLTSEVDKLQPNQFIMLKEKTGPGSFDYHQNPLKVLEVKADKVFVAAWTAHSENQKVTYDNTLAEVVNEHEPENSFWIDKATLKKAVIQKREDEATFQGIEIKSYATGSFFALDKIVPRPTPLLKQDYSNEANSNAYAEINNDGLNVTADSVVSLTEGITWQLSKKRSFNRGERIAIKASGVGRANIYFSDKAHNKFVFEASNDNRLWSFEESK